MQTRIKGYTFQISEPFQAGTVLTKGEAQALNDLRVENISNNLRKLVAEATAELPDGQLLPTGTLTELQARITKYDLGYQFAEKMASRPRRGDIELTTREVAEELVQARLRQAGIEMSSDDPGLETAIREAEGLPQVLEEARARVTARRSATSGALEDL